MKLAEKILIGSLVLLILSFFGCALMIERANLVYDVRLTRIREMVVLPHDEFIKQSEAYEKGESYDDMVWDFSKWNYEQFYGPHIIDPRTETMM